MTRFGVTCVKSYGTKGRPLHKRGRRWLRRHRAKYGKNRRTLFQLRTREISHVLNRVSALLDYHSKYSLWFPPHREDTRVLRYVAREYPEYFRRLRLPHSFRFRLGSILSRIRIFKARVYARRSSKDRRCESLLKRNPPLPRCNKLRLTCRA